MLGGGGAGVRAGEGGRKSSAELPMLMGSLLGVDRSSDQNAGASGAVEKLSHPLQGFPTLLCISPLALLPAPTQAS